MGVVGVQASPVMAHRRCSLKFILISSYSSSAGLLAILLFLDFWYLWSGAIETTNMNMTAKNSSNKNKKFHRKAKRALGTRLMFWKSLIKF